MKIGTIIYFVLFATLAFGQQKKPYPSNEPPVKYRMSECIATGLTLGVRNDLAMRIGKATNVDELKVIISKWSIDNRLADVQATIREVNGSPNKYVWLQGRKFGGSLTMVTGTRSETDNSISSPLLDCMFSDTLLILDTLKLLVAKSASDQFLVQTSGSLIPLPKTGFGAILLSQSTMPGTAAGQYADVVVIHRSGSQAEVKRKVKVYIFTDQERRDFASSLQEWFSGSELKCDEMVEYATGYLLTSLGGGHCDLSDRYKIAMANSVRKLLKSSLITCEP